MLDDETILGISEDEGPIEKIAAKLVSEAEKAGGYDNITVVLINID